jgi:hypothetical protein
MRIILIAALFLLPLSAVSAAATHHPVTGKKLHNAMPVRHPVTGKKLHNAMPVRHPVTGKKLHNAVKPAKPKS